ncbi:MAG: peptidase S8 and S53 subtilisin kexin sedolisin [Sylvanvirus sp.]|uniref:Peptidase S8 and S53 subtilisin kexin sedolisin n=1 Tax=Sylvanvirus sp. TaxID=2487774 RepID=A0A3G5AIP2_9VIRU|nr:MAG: peptidase S8 and S53 subtilisin kexin sedolisin [Sylvanvirus sp.]
MTKSYRRRTPNASSNAGKRVKPVKSQKTKPTKRFTSANSSASSAPYVGAFAFVCAAAWYLKDKAYNAISDWSSTSSQDVCQPSKPLITFATTQELDTCDILTVVGGSSSSLNVNHTVQMNDQKNQPNQTQSIEPISEQLHESKNLQNVSKESTSPTNYSGTIIARPHFHVKSAGVMPSATKPQVVITGYTPAQIRKLYGLDQIQADGSGQTIAVIGAYLSPTLLGDFKAYDAQFNLGHPNVLTIHSFATKGDVNWGVEGNLDVMTIHAIAPAANILYVGAYSASLADLEQAEAYALNTPNVTIITRSWGATEVKSETTMETNYATSSKVNPQIVHLASSGDTAHIPIWPSVSGKILSVGGTTMKMNPTTGSYISETPWSSGGGGISVYEPIPSFQTTFGLTGTKRHTPDVSMDADPNTGLAILDTYGYQNSSGWFEVGGTSLSCPLWAGVIALTNQLRVAAQKKHFDTLTLQTALYVTIGKSAHYQTDFHTLGGYSLVTGLGTPLCNAQSGLVYDLVHTVP